MSTYKVIQDVEAEDKLVGPLTLRQFIYAGIAATSGYLGFLLSTKGAAFMLVIFFPVTLVCAFFAFPWRQDQPTEVWALAKIRFALKPRRRIWDQTGAKELVTVTAPKHIERHLTNGLNQDEVQSRLSALANTIDSRGWATKNVNVNLSAGTMLPMADMSDRLVAASSFPQEVTSIDVRPADDMLDEANSPVAQHFDTMITASSNAHRQQIVQQMQQSSAAPPLRAPKPSSSAPAQPPADYWFMHQPTPVPGQATFVSAAVVAPGTDGSYASALTPDPSAPTPEEQALIEKLRSENEKASLAPAYGHMKVIKTPEQLAQEARATAATAKPQVTPDTQAAIMNLANNDDLDVATIARQANKQAEPDEGVDNEDGEVIISLR